MNCRRFITLSSSAAAWLPFVGVGGAVVSSDGSLAGHRLSALDTKPVPLPWPRHVGRNAKRDVHGHGPTVTVAILKTDQGAVGWGELGGGPRDLERVRPNLLGKRVSEVFDPVKGIPNPELKPLDIALHDLAGVILGLPVWKLFGAPTPQVYPIYSGMIYFDDLHPPDHPAGIDQVLKNCAADRAFGYRQLKVKIGRGNKWISPVAGLKRDVENVIRGGKLQLSAKPGFGLALRNA